MKGGERMPEINVLINPVYYPYLNDERRTQIFFGGSSSGKSYFLAQRTVIEALNGHNYLIVRKVARTIRGSVFNEITKAIYNMGVEKEFSLNRSDMTITNLKKGNQILFAGLDNVEKLKSITPAKGVVDTIWIEEATEVLYGDIKQLNKRLRGISEKKKKMIISFNPILKSHHLYTTYFKDCWDDSKRIYEDGQKLILKTTYINNKFLAPEDIYNLEHEQDEYFYQVYTLGNFGILGNIVFKNWETQDLTSKMNSFEQYYYGLDPGWNDPTAVVKLAIDNDKKEIYVLDEIYKSGITIESLGRELQQFVGTHYLMCDSAEPRTINELNQMGIRATAVIKGPDSITYGIRFLQNYKIIVDLKCQNFINEISTYHFQENKDGEVMEVPVDKNNHLLDSMRYALNNLIMQNKASATNRTY